MSTSGRARTGRAARFAGRHDALAARRDVIIRCLATALLRSILSRVGTFQTKRSSSSVDILRRARSISSCARSFRRYGSRRILEDVLHVPPLFYLAVL